MCWVLGQYTIYWYMSYYSSIQKLSWHTTVFVSPFSSNFSVKLHADLYQGSECERVWSLLARCVEQTRSTVQRNNSLLPKKKSFFVSTGWLFCLTLTSCKGSSHSPMKRKGIIPPLSVAKTQGLPYTWLFWMRECEDRKARREKTKWAGWPGCLLLLKMPVWYSVEVTISFINLKYFDILAETY